MSRDIRNANIPKNFQKLISIYVSIFSSSYSYLTGINKHSETSPGIQFKPFSLTEETIRLQHEYELI